MHIYAHRYLYIYMCFCSYAFVHGVLIAGFIQCIPVGHAEGKALDLKVGL